MSNQPKGHFKHLTILFIMLLIKLKKTHTIKVLEAHIGNTFMILNQNFKLEDVALKKADFWLFFGTIRSPGNTGASYCTRQLAEVCVCVCDTFEVRNIPNPRRGISTVLSNRILKQGVFMMGRPNPF